MSTAFRNGEIETLKMIFDGCQRLERIGISYGANYFNESELLEVIANHSPKKFHEIKLDQLVLSPKEISLNELEPIFKSWARRQSQKPLSLVIMDRSNKLKVKKGIYYSFFHTKS